MRARVVRTAKGQQRPFGMMQAPSALTLRDVNVTAWEAVKGGQAGVHVDAMLQQDVNCLSRLQP
jgi:hypothetical protein